jgi:hypothetical protein
MPTQEELMFKQWEDEANERQQLKNTAIMQSPSMFAYNQQKQNLIEKELDFSGQLESIERLLRCDIIKIDQDGNQIWTPNPNKDQVFLNELGVNDVMRFIVTIINPNKILSYYTIEEIDLRVRQIKHEIRMMIYNNYELYEMNTLYKWNYYPMAVISIGSTIEDTYRRALNGETHKGLTEQRSVIQSESLQPQQYNQMNQPTQNKKKLFNPLTWFNR